jgi:hypothetical protein
MSGEDLESYSTAREVVDGVDEVTQVAAEPVELELRTQTSGRLRCPAPFSLLE